jgi:hypothetical protein
MKRLAAKFFLAEIIIEMVTDQNCFGSDWQLSVIPTVSGFYDIESPII